jgi:inorganic pyrophosphatase
MRSAKRLAPLFAILLSIGPGAQSEPAPRTLPEPAARKLSDSLKQAAAFDRHVWRDTPPVNGDGTINAYVEIPLGDREKWEFDMAANARKIDRMMPEEVGGYPINYGFVPQTVSYDGDPFDVLVLGPRLPGGQIVRGIPVGVMLMEDEKGLDSKVVISQVDAAGLPRHQLAPRVQDDVAGYFRRYKLHEPGAWSRVPGWGSAADGEALVKRTHTFFKECRTAAAPCTVSP